MLTGPGPPLPPPSPPQCRRYSLPTQSGFTEVLLLCPEPGHATREARPDVAAAPPPPPISRAFYGRRCEQSFVFDWPGEEAVICGPGSEWPDD